MPDGNEEGGQHQRSVADAVQHYQRAQADYEKAVQRVNRCTAPRALDAVSATGHAVAASRRATELVRRAAAMRSDLPTVAVELLGGLDMFDRLIADGVESAKFAADAAHLASGLAVAIAADDPLATAGPRTREAYARLSRAIDEELQRSGPAIGAAGSGVGKP